MRYTYKEIEATEKGKDAESYYDWNPCYEPEDENFKLFTEAYSWCVHPARVRPIVAIVHIIFRL
jgi:hypothetical protein